MIRVNLDVMPARRKIRLGELADRVGVTIQNLSVLKTGKARAIRFSTLAALCAALDCQPGDLLEFDPSQPVPDGDDRASEQPQKTRQVGHHMEHPRALGRQRRAIALRCVAKAGNARCCRRPCAGRAIFDHHAIGMLVAKSAGGV